MTFDPNDMSTAGPRSPIAQVFQLGPRLRCECGGLIHWHEPGRYELQCQSADCRAIYPYADAIRANVGDLITGRFP